MYNRRERYRETPIDALTNPNALPSTLELGRPAGLSNGVSGAVQYDIFEMRVNDDNYLRIDLTATDMSELFTMKKDGIKIKLRSTPICMPDGVTVSEVLVWRGPVPGEDA